MFDMVGGDDSRFQVKDSPLQKLWVYMGQNDVDPIALFNRLAEATQDVVD